MNGYVDQRKCLKNIEEIIYLPSSFGQKSPAVKIKQKTIIT